MPFNSLAYLLLLTTTGLLTAALRVPGPVLIAASLVFYAFAGAFDTAVFLGAVTLNWLVQWTFAPGRGRIAAAVVVNLGLIGYFKYSHFLLGGAGRSGTYIDIGLPLGISFYSLQALAYQIDVSRGRSKPARSFAEFLLFKAFFPQLIAGPIVRARQLLPQVQGLMDGVRRRHRLLAFGFGLIVMGLVKKVVFADSLAPIVDEIFGLGPDSTITAWLGALLFTFQIYFDFSGYSDIAIGSAYLLGVRLPQNFATPFVARSIQEFWQRWHITLTRFLRDYVFLPLVDARIGGARFRAAEPLAAMVVTMTLCGLWHGAGLTFIVWGALQGVAMVVAVVWTRRFPTPGRWLGWVLTIGFFVVTSVFFRSADLGHAVHYLGTMVSFQAMPPQDIGAAPVWQAGVGVAGLFALHFGEHYLQRAAFLNVLRRIDGPLLRGLLIGLALLLVLIPSYNSNPFIYFRF